MMDSPKLALNRSLVRYFFQIGLMRNGILLAEDSPENLLSRFEATSLEDAFLQLCMKHGKSDEANQALKQINIINSNHIMDRHDISKTSCNEKENLENSLKMNERKSSLDSDNTDTLCGPNGVGDINCNKKSLMRKLQFTSKRKMKALLVKNFITMLRQPA